MSESETQPLLFPPPSDHQLMMRRERIAAARIYLLFGFQFILFVMGVYYSFPMWLPDFQTKFEISDVTVQLVGGFSYLATTLSFFVVAWLAARKVPRRVQYPLSLTFLAGGYLILWLTTLLMGPKESSLAGVALCIGTFTLATGIGVSYASMFNDLMVMFSEMPDILTGVMNIVFVSGGLVVCLAYYFASSTPLSTLLMSVFFAHALLIPFSYFLASKVNKILPESSEGLPLGFMQAAKAHFTSLEGILLVAICTLIMGVGTTYAGSLGQWVESLGEDNRHEDFASAMFICGQGTGRVIYTLTSVFWMKVSHKYLLSSSPTPTSSSSSSSSSSTPSTAPSRLVLVMVLALGVLFVAGCLFALNSSKVWPPLILFSLGYGLLWPSTGTIPLQSVLSPAQYPWLTMAALTLPFGGISSIIFNTIAGEMYNKHADPVTKKCTGMKCYESVWHMLLIMSILVIFLSFALLFVHQSRSSTAGRNRRRRSSGSRSLRRSSTTINASSSKDLVAFS